MIDNAPLSNHPINDVISTLPLILNSLNLI